MTLHIISYQYQAMPTIQSVTGQFLAWLSNNSVAHINKVTLH